MGLPFPSFVIAIAISAGIAILSPLRAGSPYGGWQGQNSASGIYHDGSPSGPGGDRRPLDGSLRTPRAYSPPPATVPDDPPHAPAWAGLTVGVDGGLGFGTSELGAPGRGSVDLDGWLLGAHAGYHLQQDQFVAGLEIDGQWSGIDGARLGNGSGAITSEIDWLSSARLRLGVAQDNLLLYATGGPAFGGLDLRNATPSGMIGTSATLVGYAAGAGIEMRLSPTVSGRVEAIHYGFRSTDVTGPVGPMSIDPDVTTVRAGLSVRLD